ncbi:MAG: trypsin-like serine protease [Actinomycetales bacterium]
MPASTNPRPRTWLTTLALTASALLLGTTVAAAPATAITGGQDDGDEHPNVAFVLALRDGIPYRCSATLVTPTVLLTAGHCTQDTQGMTLVTFDPVLAEGPPAPVPAPEDPAAGYTEQELHDAGFLAAVPATHPEHPETFAGKAPRDVGVLVLTEPVADVEPAPVAPVGRLDGLRQNELTKTLFTEVGYGTRVDKGEDGNSRPTRYSYPLLRRSAQAPGQKLTEQTLLLNGNIHDTRGTGGSCAGDSGGPTLLDGEVVGVISFGYTENCRYIDGIQRVDTLETRQWLAGYGIPLQ